MTNRLAHAQSLYLRKHAENPIDWWSWSDDAIAAAQHENKPIFLSIGYSSCHWCTVMEGEAFSDLAIAEYMNANFLPIKVDREERPDIDSIYMQALQMIAGQGGWPLNVFLSPDDLTPFYGGTYFPVEPRYGRPGFLQVLTAIRHFYDTDQAKLQSIKAEILGNLQQATRPEGSGVLSRDLLHLGLEASVHILTTKGVGPSFPMIPYAVATLNGSRFQFEQGDNAAKQRGLDLALGGICDQVGGGFHRYTVDPTWTVPHFEKMLYDNGQIVEYLANLWSAGVSEPAFERAIAKTSQWLKREMTAPQGYFYAAQDADSFVTPSDAEPEEGAFYIWNYTELEQLLTDAELAALSEQFTATRSGNFEGQNVLQRRHPGKLTEPLEATLAKLFVVRYGSSPDAIATFPPACNNDEAKSQPWAGRIPAVTDTKMIVAWNSLMISGLARAAAVFQQPDYLQLAAQAAQFILNNQWIGERFHRLNYDGKATVFAQSEDYALLIKALLDLDQAAMTVTSTAAPMTVEPSNIASNSNWLEQAIRVQAEFDDRLWSTESAGYYNTADSEHLIVRERSYSDNATPSANGVAIANLIRLALLTENLSYLDRAEQALQAFSNIMRRAPHACPSLFVALDWYCHLTLVRTTTEQMTTLAVQYFPTAVLAIEPLPAEAIGLVCQGLSCQEPAYSEDQLYSQLQQSQMRTD
jgi:uncharacterized protein